MEGNNARWNVFCFNDSCSCVKSKINPTKPAMMKLKIAAALVTVGMCSSLVFAQDGTTAVDTTVEATPSETAAPADTTPIPVDEPVSSETVPTTDAAIPAPNGVTPTSSETQNVQDPLIPGPAPIDPPPETLIDPPAAAGATPPLVNLSDEYPQGASIDPNRRSPRDFSEEDLKQVLRLLARQAKVNMVVSDAVIGTITLRLEDVTAMEALHIIVTAKGLIMDQVENVYYVKTAAEKAAEPTESASYQFSYARGENIKSLLQDQLQSKVPPQVDARTNTIFYREVRSNLDNIALFLETVDRPTRQVMIEARLVEVTANPKQSYGINWAGVVGGSSTPQTFRYGGSPFPDDEGVYEMEFGENGQAQLFDFLRYGETSANSVPFPTTLGDAVAGQFAILSVPQFSATLRLLNEDQDAEFLAHPRIVTADNQEATIEITRNQPVPQLNFNEQTATAVFGGFEDKLYGNTLKVLPSINKDDYITLSVQPTISNKVADATFIFQGAAVSSPVIDTRSLESNVLIQSGNTLAIGGLLQDESGKATAKVPVLGDIPILGYLFQEKMNSRTKRNLLVFVTPTILEMGQGTGLEDQVNGLYDTGEEYADPNGWRNNAKGAVRIVPTSHRQSVSNYPVPGTPVAPRSGGSK